METKLLIRSLFGIILISALSVRPSFAEVPVQQGLSTEVSPEVSKELATWLNEAKTELQEASDQIPQLLQPLDVKTLLLKTFRKVVPDSGKKQQYTLLREALDRALKISEQLEETAIDSTSIDQEVRVLKKSLSIALRYSSADLMNIQDAMKPLPYAEFAVEEADALLWINESEINAKTQFDIAVEVLAWMHVDLSKDEMAQLFLPSIADVEKLLSKFKAPDFNQIPALAMDDIRKVYFQALTDLMNTDTPVGKRIQKIEIGDKILKPDKRLRL